ncbi:MULTISPECIES: type II toxin-antitoxin system Phd/YefM family antitoxin [unclassified Streptomyces]|uniref:type II toxin-antitoxin system Phd/YefM family antitoxin n=1 Tax=unclassified Streptomyces TaxID=2593676 RepID=UPI0022B6B05E|nr:MULTISPECIES: type II toxin-antitoxin system Phd/YefM family antitoxin [unclassified Streptomyces]MCZ7414908.1 type II toxin-antitoxin system Phd/YefM family antitoxin [Streptomyces sp. WMMC897]MCZ7431851.1 type II toxin-antitoxin system Phd/YefM family antitoxin [Streptomyces sp. WMMC1477]
MADNVSVRDARAHLADLLDKAAQGDPTVITRAGLPVAAVVSIEDLTALEDAADELLAREATQALAEEGDGPTYSMAEVVADIFEGPDRSRVA